MKPLYKKIMDEKESRNLQIVVDVVQSALLVTTQTIFFPAAAALSLYKTYRHWKKYKKKHNKNLRKKTSLAISLLSTCAEVVAVSAMAATYFGLQLLTAGVISAIFLGSIAIQFVSHLTQTLYHGFRWILSASNTKQNERHKNHFGRHLRSTIVLGVIGTSIGLLIVAPAFHLFTLSVGIITAVKAMSATMVGLNAIKSIHMIYQKRQQKKQRALEWEEKDKQARAKRNELREIQQELKKAQISLLDETKEFNPNEIIELLEKLQTTEYVDEPPSYNKTRAYFGSHAALRLKYQMHCPNLKKDNINDLVRTLEATDEVDGPRKIILVFLRKTIDAILKNVALNYEPDQITQQLELTKDGRLPPIHDKNFILFSHCRQIKWRDRLHAVLLLEALVRKDKKSELRIKERGGGVSSICTAYDLMEYIKRKNKTENVFQTFFSSSEIEKLFGLVDYYLNHKDLHPDTRESYEKTRRNMVTPS